MHKFEAYNTINYSYFINNRQWLYLIPNLNDNYIIELKYTTTFLDLISGPFLNLLLLRKSSLEFERFETLIEWIPISENLIQKYYTFNYVFKILDFLIDSEIINFNTEIQYNPDYVYRDKFGLFCNSKKLPKITLFNFFLKSLFGIIKPRIGQEYSNFKQLIIKMIKTSNINVLDSVNILKVDKNFKFGNNYTLRSYSHQIGLKAELIETLSKFNYSIVNRIFDNITPFRCTLIEHSTSMSESEKYMSFLKYNYEN